MGVSCSFGGFAQRAPETRSCVDVLSPCLVYLRHESHCPVPAPQPGQPHWGAFSVCLKASLRQKCENLGQIRVIPNFLDSEAYFNQVKS